MQNKKPILRYKDDIETAYSSILADYATKVPCDNSRRFLEEENPFENRSSFQRDRDRIIHSSAFRRMMYKTQVFVNHEGDHFRTRLTHSLEVAQFARGIAKSLALNEDLAEAIALGHDLGHTPFGHASESILDAKLKTESLGGFFHNEQSIRVVDLLEMRDNDIYNGLNLTFEVREGILKHNNDRTGLYPELNPYQICSTLEGQIVKLTDTVAYTCHDLDDGIKSAILETNCVRNPDINREFDLIKERVADETNIILNFHSYDNLKFIGTLIHYFINNITLNSYKNFEKYNIQTHEDVKRLASEGISLIAFDDKTADLFHALKKFVGKSIYSTSTVQMMDVKAENVIEKIYDALYKNTLLLPSSWRFKVENYPKLPEYHTIESDTAARSRIICDYISCMTDRYALEEYERLFNPNIKI